MSSVYYEVTTPKEDTIMKEITLEQIKKYNQMVEAAIGTEAYNKLALPMEYKDDDTKRWIGNPYGYHYPISIWEEDAKYYLKKVCGMTYLYMNLCGDPADRYYLEDNEIAKAFFGV
jgi:hypothetical protein